MIFHSDGKRPVLKKDVIPDTISHSMICQCCWKNSAVKHYVRGTCDKVDFNTALRISWAVGIAMRISFMPSVTFSVRMLIIYCCAACSEGTPPQPDPIRDKEMGYWLDAS